MNDLVTELRTNGWHVVGSEVDRAVNVTKPMPLEEQIDLCVDGETEYWEDASGQVVAGSLTHGFKPELATMASDGGVWKVADIRPGRFSCEGLAK